MTAELSRAARATEQRSRIETAAYRLFVERGYEATSFQDIARGASTKKQLVQYYFPQKPDLLVLFMRRVLRLAEEVAESRHLMGASRFARLFVVAQIQLSFLFTKAPSLALDILASRRLSTEIVSFDLGWISETMQSTPKEAIEISDGLRMAVGGLYEICFYRLSNDQDIDVQRVAGQMMQSFMTSLGYSTDEAAAELAPYRLDAGMRDSSSDLVHDLVVSSGTGR
ncbi:TetR/AcrR family transcriptional regulator [Frondihabitans cladoniiphilus]